MKKFIYYLSIFVLPFAFCLTSCSDDEETEEYIDEDLNDPKLNVTEYTFPAEGGVLEIYSTIGRVVLFTPKTPDATYKFDDYGNTYLDGGWYQVTWKKRVDPATLQNLHVLYLSVEPNETGEEREITSSMMLSCRDSVCQDICYKQSK